MQTLAQRFDEVRQQIAAACARSGRDPGAVRLVAVSKTFPAAAIETAVAAGQSAFGENYVREALDKMGLAESLTGRRLEWHFIGPIQSNKCRAVAGAFAWVHGIDRLRIAQRLSDLRAAVEAPLQVCIQVNISAEPSKSGIAPDEARTLCAAVARLPHLCLRGLMAIPAPAATAELSRPAFRALGTLHQSIRDSGDVDPDQFDTLSMGMSDDFAVAVEEGATLVRIGSRLFGTRPPASRPDALHAH